MNRKHKHRILPLAGAVLVLSLAAFACSHALNAGQTVRIDVEEAPQNDPAAILLSKADAERYVAGQVVV